MRGDKAPILKLDLNKSDSELTKIADAFGIDKGAILRDKSHLKTLFFQLDNNLNYILFAYVRKGKRKGVEYMMSFDKYLMSLEDSNLDTFLNIKETFERVNNNTKYLLGEKVDEDKIKDQDHLKNLSAKNLNDKSPKRKQKKKKVKKESVNVEQKNINIDSVLDKISKSGIESLSKVEKNFLEDYSKGI
jgi:hypothetical protein